MARCGVRYRRCIGESHLPRLASSAGNSKMGRRHRIRGRCLLLNASRNEVVDDLFVYGIAYLEEVKDLEEWGKEALDQHDKLRLDVAKQHDLS